MLKLYFFQKTLKHYFFIGLGSYSITSVIMVLLTTKILNYYYGIFLTLPSIFLNHVGYFSYLRELKKHSFLINDDGLKSVLAFLILSFFFIFNFFILVIFTKFIYDSILS